LVKILFDCGFAQSLPNLLFFTAFAGLIIYAAISDARSFRIPNSVSLALIGLFFVRLLVSVPPAGVTAHLLTAAVAFAIFFTLYLLGWFGAGDTKLITAILLWTGPIAGLQFVVALALAGGVFALALLALAKGLKAYSGLGPYVPARARRWAEHGVCPYGLPILAAALLVLPQLLADSACRPL
jgi:prepilin peptidase CpaA